MEPGQDVVVAQSVDFEDATHCAGAAPTVDTCADFADGVGHLSPAAKTYLGTRLGQYYAAGVAPTPTPTRTRCR